jgi:acyl carrier protein
MILDKIKKILGDQLGIEESKITPSTNLIEDLGADSLDLVEMLLTLENDMDIKFDDTDTSAIKTVQDVIDTVEKLKK